MTLHVRPVVRFCSLVAIGLFVGSASASLQVPKGSEIPLDVKLGLWEITTAAQISGMPPVDTSKMTPEQRKRMEGAMEAAKRNAAQPHTRRTCLTKEKIEKGFMEERGQSCQQTVLTATTKKYAVKFQCGGAEPSSGEWHFEALTPENIKGSGTFVVEGTKAASTAEMTGKWIGPACGDVK